MDEPPTNSGSPPFWNARRKVVALALAAAAVSIAVFALLLPDGEEPLLPPGTYTTFEEATRATGFEIPMAHEIDGWRLDRIEVTTPDLVSGEPKKADINRMRFVTVRYVAEQAKAVEILVSIVKDDALTPTGGGGPVTSVQVHGRPAILQEKSLADGRITLASIQWTQGDLHIEGTAFLRTPVVAGGRTLDPGFTLAEFMALVESVR